MSDRDNITLPREVVEEALEALAKTPCNSVYEQDCSVCNAEEALRKALAAEQPKQEPVAWVWLKDGIPVNVFLSRGDADDPYWLDRGYSTAPLYTAPAAPEPPHPGYVIGSHWLETAYSRVCAGEAEADVLKDCGWERVDDAEALRLNNARYRWLKSRAEDYDGHVCFGDVKHPAPIPDCSPFDAIDAAIDAAMKEDKT